MRSRIAGLCLVATFLTLIISVSEASAALPEFRGPFPNKFASTSGKTTLETVTGLKVVCKKDTATGEVTGPKTDSVTITLIGCVLNGIVCNTPGVAAGDIVTSPLFSTLGYINKAKKEVGDSLENPTGAPFAQFICGSGLTVTVTGSVIGRIKPINTLIPPPKHFKIAFKQAAGKQKSPKLEGGPIDVLGVSLNGGPSEEAGLSSTETLTFAAPTEVSA
jgi:hypothetical protein